MKEKFTPDIQKIKKTSAKVQEICKRADVEIAILDDLIAQLDQDIKDSVLYKYHSGKVVGDFKKL
jgi:hypothetical protein